MANYTINIESSPGGRDASPNFIVFAAGDTVMFTADSQDSNLCLTSATAAILSPAPSSLQVAIAAGTSVSFTLTSAATGAYAAQVMPGNVDCAGSIPGWSAEGGAVLVVMPGEDPGADTPPPATDPDSNALQGNPPPPPGSNS